MSAYRGSGNSYLAGQRYATKLAQQARRSRASAAELAEAERAYDAADAANDAEAYDTPGRPAWQAFKIAREALREIAPDHYRFS